jgi:hypothetical protein
VTRTITNSTEHSFSWEANSPSTPHKFIVPGDSLLRSEELATCRYFKSRKYCSCTLINLHNNVIIPSKFTSFKYPLSIETYNQNQYALLLFNKLKHKTRKEVTIHFVLPLLQYLFLIVIPFYFPSPLLLISFMMLETGL